MAKMSSVGEIIEKTYRNILRGRPTDITSNRPEPIKGIQIVCGPLRPKGLYVPRYFRSPRTRRGQVRVSRKGFRRSLKEFEEGLERLIQLFPISRAEADKLDVRGKRPMNRPAQLSTHFLPHPFVLR